MKYVISKYVNFIADGDYTIMFNLRTSTFSVLSNKLGTFVESIRDNADILQEKHSDLFTQMLEKRFIVDSELDEAVQLVEEWKRADSDPSYFSMIINPTLGCNLRCWYCYENHEHKPLMKQEVIDAIFKLIDKKTQSEELRNLDVSFFGGEPLVGFDKVVKPILEHASARCKAKGIGLTSHFTTNGVLLTDEKLDFLGSIAVSSPISFQVSFDGNRELHNQSRVDANKTPTYDTIISNVKKAAERNFIVNVRLNYTAANAMSFLDVLDYFAELPNHTKQFINFNFQQIWQDKANNDISGQIETLKADFQKENFCVSSDNISHRHWCYGDRENSIVVNYDGNIFKCTARDFNKNNREGVLTVTGDIEWNERYRRRMAVKYSNKNCLACKIMPICNGGCSQNKLDIGCASTCFRDMDENEKEQQIIGRLREVITEKQAH